MLDVFIMMYTWLYMHIASHCIHMSMWTKHKLFDCFTCCRAMFKQHLRNGKRAKDVLTKSNSILSLHRSSCHLFPSAPPFWFQASQTYRAYSIPIATALSAWKAFFFPMCGPFEPFGLLLRSSALIQSFFNVKDTARPMATAVEHERQG